MNKIGKELDILFKSYRGYMQSYYINEVSGPNTYYKIFHFSKKEYDILFEFLGAVLFHKGSEYKIIRFLMKNGINTKINGTGFFIRVAIVFFDEG